MTGRFVAIIAQLETLDGQLDRDSAKADCGFVFVLRALRQIADEAEAKGGAWAAERARSMIAEWENR